MELSKHKFTLVYLGFLCSSTESIRDDPYWTIKNNSLDLILDPGEDQFVYIEVIEPLINLALVIEFIIPKSLIIHMQNSKEIHF